MRIASLALAALFSVAAHAATPPPVATIDITTWPEKLDSPVLFDVASRAQVLSFARELAVSEHLDEAALASRLGLRQVNLVTLKAVRERLWQRLWQSFDAAQQSCDQDASFCFAIDNEAALKAQAMSYQIPSDSFYAGWAPNGQAFYRTYLDELLREAALFPQVSSEIARFSDLERNGDELNDRLFVLTFDGGPGPGTADLTDYLRRQSMPSTFFVLGQSLEQRRDQGSVDSLQALYRNQCVGLNGWQQRSHAQWRDWQDSVLKTQARVQGDLPTTFVPLFRPPYGQRRADAQPFFTSQGLQVVLWDIDSADAQPKVTSDQAAQRVLSLMLLWRRGIIQFHDSQPKAQSAVAWLLSKTSQSGIGWLDCHTFAAKRS